MSPAKVSKTKALKPIPKFANEDAERAFWATHDTTEYIDWSQARSVVFPNLRPSTETISLRLPSPLLADLKSLANERDVPYQSLLKVFLADQVRREQASEGQPNTRLLRTAAPPRTKRQRRVKKSSVSRR
ncbi:MAG: BrnA antitoxin family protein [Gemmatimonadales bacterium]